MSDMAGKAAREAVEPSGSERDTMLLAADLNRANGMSEIEGKATRVGASERGQQTNGAAGGVRHRWANRQVEMGGST